MNTSDSVKENILKQLEKKRNNFQKPEQKLEQQRKQDPEQESTALDDFEKKLSEPLKDELFEINFSSTNISCQLAQTRAS